MPTQKPAAGSRPKVLVVGVGNEYRQDDGVGPAVIGELRPRVPDGVDVCVHQGDGVTLTELWNGYDRVIVVDAAASGAEPGTVHRLEAHRRPVPRTLFRYSTHDFGLAEAVELARALDTMPDELIIYGVEGERFGHGRGLSPRVQAAVNEVIAQILRDVRRD